MGLRSFVLLVLAGAVLTGCFRTYSNYRPVGGYELDGTQYLVVRADWTTASDMGSDLILMRAGVTDYANASRLAVCTTAASIEDCEKAFGAQLREAGISTTMGDDY